MKGTDEDSLMEIICSRPNPILKKIKEKYKKKIGKDLESDLKSDIKGDLQKILLSIIQLLRRDNKKTNIEECQNKGKKLQEARVKKWKTDESTFSQIFSTLSPEELIYILQEYHKITVDTILEVIDKEFSGNMKKAFKAIVYTMLSPSEYFVIRVKDAIKGFGTNYNLLMRILISKDEIDMQQFKYFYSKLYGKNMVSDIKTDNGGIIKN